MSDERNVPHAPSAADVRGLAVRRDLTHGSFVDQAAQGGAIELPSHQKVPANARYLRTTKFTRFVGLTQQWETVLLQQIPEGYQGRLDFVGIETSNFGPFGDDESVEWHIQLDGTLLTPFESWMGCTQPLREPVREQTPSILPPGSVLTLTARLVPVLMGGSGDGVNAFDVRAEFGIWAFPI